MFFILIFLSLLFLKENIKTKLLWNYTKLTTYFDLWLNKNNNEVSNFEILSVYSINQKKYINKKNIRVSEKKIIINSDSDNDESYLIKYKLKNNNFRIIITEKELKEINLIIENIKEPSYLSVLNHNKEDITDIINQHSGPNRNFYLNQIKLYTDKLDLDPELNNCQDINIIDNLANEFKLSKLSDFINYFSAN
jgi:hypothetical protein